MGRVGGKRSVETRRERGKSVRERIAERVEAEFEKFWTAFDGAVVATTDGAPDHRVRLEAARSALAEAYGRPPQAIVGDSDKPVTFRLVSAFELDNEPASASNVD